MTTATVPRSFDEYTRSLDFLVKVGDPEAERIWAAWIAGGRRGDRHPTDTYLFDRLRAAFGSR